MAGKAKEVVGDVLVSAATGALKGAVVGAIEATAEAAGIAPAKDEEKPKKNKTKK